MPRFPEVESGFLVQWYRDTLAVHAATVTKRVVGGGWLIEMPGALHPSLRTYADTRRPTVHKTELDAWVWIGRVELFSIFDPERLEEDRPSAVLAKAREKLMAAKCIADGLEKLGVK